MQNVIQFPRRKLSLRQKIGYFLLAIIESFESSYYKVSEYFGVNETKSDQIWFFGFYGTVAVLSVLFLFLQLNPTV